MVSYFSNTNVIKIDINYSIQFATTKHIDWVYHISSPNYKKIKMHEERIIKYPYSNAYLPTYNY